MRIVVTLLHILHGRPLHDGCPIALAIREALGVALVLIVENRALVVDPVSLAVVQAFKLPNNAWAWARRFDHGQRVEPFKFVLEPEAARAH